MKKRFLTLLIMYLFLTGDMRAGSLDGVIASLGNPLVHLALIMTAIVSVIVNYEKVTDKNGSGERMTGLMNIALMVMSTYLIVSVFLAVKQVLTGISIGNIRF